MYIQAICSSGSQSMAAFDSVLGAEPVSRAIIAISGVGFSNELQHICLTGKG
jgi:hypothetical protein